MMSKKTAIVISLGLFLLSLYPNVVLYASEAASYFQKGRQCYINGKYDKAITEFKNALKSHPEPNHIVDIYFALGRTYYAKEMINEAIKNFKAADKHAITQKQSAKIFYWLGVAYFEKGMYDEAIKSYKTALKYPLAKSYLSYSHFVLGVIYERKEMYDEAIAEFKQVLKIEPNMIDSHAYLGDLYATKKMYDEAIKEFESVLKIDPTWDRIAIVYYSLGLLYIQKFERSEKEGDKEGMEIALNKALENYKMVLKTDINYEDADFVLYEIGRINLEKGNVSEASKILSKLKKQYPESEHVLRLEDEIKYYSREERSIK